MLMLQIVIRASIESCSMARPRYSMTCPWAPLVPILAMMARMMSLAPLPEGRSPSMVTLIVLKGAMGRVWVARTCSTWEVPIPKARAPKAPWVEVWESPQTTVMPGWVRPSCGPTAWTIPWSASPRECSRTPNSAQLARRVSI